MLIHGRGNGATEPLPTWDAPLRLVATIKPDAETLAAKIEPSSVVAFTAGQMTAMTLALPPKAAASCVP